jgi:hypothetical protein
MISFEMTDCARLVVDQPPYSCVHTPFPLTQIWIHGEMFLKQP